VIGASTVFAVDKRPGFAERARAMGAVPIDAQTHQPAEEILRVTEGRGTDVSLEFVGLPATIRQAIQCLAPKGRAVIAGISPAPIEIDTYRDLIGKEAEVIGSNDHFLGELHELMRFAADRTLQLDTIVTNTVRLAAEDINDVLNKLSSHRAPVRTVVVS
jgi:propanol-preferring alcohol dehydrogenase